MKINTLPSPPLPSPFLPSSREMQVQINNLSVKIEKIRKFVIKSSQELRESLKESLNKVEAVLKLEGIKAGLATVTPQDQKELLFVI